MKSKNTRLRPVQREKADEGGGGNKMVRPFDLNVLLE